jgi:hypothetical protein
MPRTPLHATTIACLLLLLAAGLPLAAETTDKRESEEGPKASPFVHATGGKPGKQPAKVYGNAELKKMFGPAPDTIVLPATPAGRPSGDSGEAAAPPSDALESLFAGEAKKKERAARIAEGEQEVAAARQKVTDLEKRMLAVRNPYLARPKAPEEGAEEWLAADTRKRVELTAQQLEAARAAVTEAEQALAELRRSTP